MGLNDEEYVWVSEEPGGVREYSLVPEFSSVYEIRDPEAVSILSSPDISQSRASEMLQDIGFDVSRLQVERWRPRSRTGCPSSGLRVGAGAIHTGLGEWSAGGTGD